MFVEENGSILTLSVKDTLEVMPDKLDLSLTVSGESKTYDYALEESVKKVNYIIDILKEAGLEEGCIKAGVVSLSPSYKYVNKTKETCDFFSEKTTENTSERKLVGYTYRNTVTAVFDVGDNTVVKVYCKLISKVVGIEINKGYRISDLRPYQDLLLTSLMKRAKADADVLASATGYTVSGLVKIDKSVQNVSLNYSRVSASALDCFDCDCDCDDGDFEDFLENSAEQMFNESAITPRIISDSVTVEYRLKEIGEN